MSLDWANRTCATCKLCDMKPRPGFEMAHSARPMYTCTRNGADAHDERRDGECGREGKFWEAK